MGLLRNRWSAARAGAADNRKEAPRARPRQGEPIQVHIVGPDSLDILNARDISATGLGVYFPHRFEGCDIKALLEIVVTLPGQKAFLARGVIQHRSDEGEGSAFFGVEFTQIAEGSRALIQDYVSRRLEDGAP